MESASSKTHLLDSSLLLCDVNVKFNWILEEHPEFVSEAHLSNLSLDEDQMLHPALWKIMHTGKKVI